MTLKTVHQQGSVGHRLFEASERPHRRVLAAGGGAGPGSGRARFWAEGLACGQVLRNETRLGRAFPQGAGAWCVDGGPTTEHRLHRRDSWSDYDPSEVLGAGGDLICPPHTCCMVASVPDCVAHSPSPHQR